MIDLAVGAVLAFVTIEDLRRFRIRNVVILILLLAFVLACAQRDRLDLLPSHLIFALAGLVLLFAAFLAGVIGGGDAKLLTAALFWIGPEGALVFSITLLACALAYIIAAKLSLAPSRKRGGRTEIPFGPSIAVAWIAFLALSASLDAKQGHVAGAARELTTALPSAAD